MRITLTVFALALPVLWACGDDGTSPEPEPEPEPEPDPVATTLDITPSAVTLASIGDSVQMEAEVRDQNGEVMDTIPVDWTSMDTTVATVDTAGWLVAVAAGAATIEAAAAGLTEEGAVAVSQVPASVTLTVPDDTLAEGEAVLIDAVVADSNGVAITGAPVSWTISDSTVAVVDAGGRVTGVRGQAAATVTAASGAASAEADVVVMAKLVFVSDRTGGADLYRMNTDGSDVERLTSNDSIDTYPKWSPDGSEIAFVSTRDHTDGEIYSMNADGTSVMRLTADTTFDTTPDWSPDGSKIAFASDRDGNQEIYVMNADGSAPTRLTNDGGADRYPDWSPDGTQIAFASDRGGDNQIYVMNADGSDVTLVTSGTVVGTNTGPLWSPDGSRVAFTSSRDDSDGDIYSMNPDGSDVVRLTESPEMDAPTSWSPDGSRLIILTGRDGDLEVYVMNADGSGQINLTNAHTTGDAWAHWRPRP